jgi:rubredoxin
MPDPNNEMKHIRKCTCGESESGDHTYGEWTMKDENYHTHSCPTCGASEDFEHSFYDWIAKDNNDHVHECMECDYESVLPHDYVREVTKEPTETEVGEATYTCSLCSHFYTEELPLKITQVTGDVVGTVLNVPAGSSAYIPDGTVFDVVEMPVEQVPEQVLGEIAVTAEGAAKPLGMYDLSLLLDGAKIQPDGTVAVTLPAPDLAAEYDTIIVVYIAPDGSYEECKTTVNEDGSITFETDHFSKYAIVGIDKTEEKEGLSVGVIIAIVVIGLIVVVGGIMTVIVRKKRSPVVSSGTSDEKISDSVGNSAVDENEETEETEDKSE